MSKQNAFDEEALFVAYGEYRRNPLCLNNAVEEPALLGCLPPLSGQRILDIGSGLGWFCEHAVKEGARKVVGVDISTRMCRETGARLCSDRLEIYNTAIEDFEYTDSAFDLVVSSLTLHYVESIEHILRKVAQWLRRDGQFIFSVNHPIYTASLEDCPPFGTDRREWWRIDDYGLEGVRTHHWFVDGVVKYHRKLETYINTLVVCGFSLRCVLEPQALPEYAGAAPELAATLRRPVFLVISALRL